MIELTQEQWHAIAQEENPTVIEPDSKTAYVVVRKEAYDKLSNLVDHETAPESLLDTIAGKFTIKLTEAEKSLSLRVIWMRRMGLDEDEITESLRSDPPVSVDQEMKELLALERLKSRPSIEMLRKIAIKS